MSITEDRLRTLKENNAESHAETVSCIKNALILLMEQKDYKDITMTDVIRKSGISRAGVYYNYKSKDEILMDVCQKPIDEVIDALGDSVFDNLVLAFRTGKKHELAIKAVLAAGLEHEFLRKMNMRVEQSSAACYVLLWNGMIFNAFFEWARAGMPGTAESAAATIKDALKLVAHAIDTGLRSRPQDAKKDANEGVWLL